MASLSYTPAPEPMGTADLAERLNDLASRQGVRLTFFPLPDGYIRITSGGTAWVMKAPEGDLEVAADRAEGEGLAEWARDQVTQPSGMTPGPRAVLPGMFRPPRWSGPDDLNDLAAAYAEAIEGLMQPTTLLSEEVFTRMLDTVEAQAALVATDAPARAPRNRAERRAMARAR